MIRRLILLNNSKTYMWGGCEVKTLLIKFSFEREKSWTWREGFWSGVVWCEVIVKTQVKPPLMRFSLNLKLIAIAKKKVNRESEERKNQR
jgi:hypothetical protein